MGITEDIKMMQKVNNAAKDSLTKNLGEYFSSLEKQNDLITDQINDLTKALITNYELNIEIAKKIGAKIPKPHTNMEIEKGD